MIRRSQLVEPATQSRIGVWPRFFNIVDYRSGQMYSQIFSKGSSPTADGDNASLLLMKVESATGIIEIKDRVRNINV